MAASPLGSTVPNTPLFNRYNVNENTDERLRLPTGSCNYTNLSVGGNAPRCGCRRFWDRSLGIQNDVGGRSAIRGWCMCEHHACFHDHGTENVQTGGCIGDGLTGGILQEPNYQPLGTPKSDQQLRERNADLHQENIPDTVPWSHYVTSGSSFGGLPSIPSQCLLPSENASIASSDQARYLRPFAGLGLETLSHIPKQGQQAMNGGQATTNENTLQIYEDSAGSELLQSLTDVATPQRVSQDLDGQTVVESHVANTFQVSETTVARTTDEAPVFRDTPDAIMTTVDSQLLPRVRGIVANYSITKQNHERRLDLLENASYTHAGFEELEGNHENLDTRVAELEERVLDIEKANAADQLSVSSRQHDSQISHISSTLDHPELASRIQALEAHVSDLQAAIPSYAKPWEVEVVFLPFGPRLTGVWSSTLPMTQRAGMDNTGSEERNPTQAYLTAQDHSEAWQNTVTTLNDHQDPWLMARACGPRSKIHERLKSRGFVRTIQICGPGYRDVQAAMMSAFGEMPSSLSDPLDQGHQPVMIPSTLQPYQGLTRPWIPLRKLHKNSCLRFLDPSEMLTPALWTVSFLTSGVAMRAKRLRRLYVTQPNSYIQSSDDSIDWIWHKLRQLPRFYPDVQSSFGHTPEADAQERCWEYDVQLDSPPSNHSSFSSHASLSIRIPPEAEPVSPSDHFSSASAASSGSGTPTSLHRTTAPLRPLSPLTKRHPFRPLHTRTTSMPSLVPLKSPQTTKRRIASFDHESQSSPTRSTSATTLNLKRRRISRSSSLHRRDSPRCVGPPTPYTFIEEVNDRRRHPTPTAYATPYSNAPYVERPCGDVPNDEGSVQIFEDEEYIDGTEDQFNSAQAGYNDQTFSSHESDEGGYYGSPFEPESDGEGDTEDDDGGEDQTEEWEGVQDGESRLGLRQEEEVDDDGVSEASSTPPSEYPSTQPQKSIFGAGLGVRGARFQIHVDEEVEGEG